MTSALIVLGVLQLIGCWILYYLFVQHGRLLLRFEKLEQASGTNALSPATSSADLSGLPNGSVLADFALDSLTGDTMTLGQWRGQRLLLIFINSDCFFSRQLMTACAALPVARADAMPVVVVICQGNLTEARRLFEQCRVHFPVLLDFVRRQRWRSVRGA
jgi:hypothetical protein